MGPISTIGSRCKAGHPNYWTQIEVVSVLFLAPHPHKLSLFLLKIPLSWSPLVTKILSILSWTPRKLVTSYNQHNTACLQINKSSAERIKKNARKFFFDCCASAKI